MIVMSERDTEEHAFKHFTYKTRKHANQQKGEKIRENTMVTTALTTTAGSELHQVSGITGPPWPDEASSRQQVWANSAIVWAALDHLHRGLEPGYHVAFQTPPQTS